MSASASKKKRKELEGQGLSSKNIAADKSRKEKNSTLKNVLIVALVLIVCAAAVFAVIKLVNRPSYDTKATVLTVGEEKLTVPVYNYFYNWNANQFYNYYSQYSQVIQSGVPFSQQSMGEGTTLEDYLKQSTNENVKNVLNLVALAKANGYTLSEEDKKTISDSVEAMKATAEQYKANFPSLEKYLNEVYGEGCDLESYEEFLTLSMIASNYSEKFQSEFHPSEEDIEKKYQEDVDAYDLVVFAAATVEAESTTVEAETEGESSEGTSETTEATQPATVYTDEAKAAAREKAEGYTKEMPEDSTPAAYGKSSIVSVYNQEIADWLFDSSRKEGDSKCFAANEDETKFYTVRYDRRETNDYYMVKGNLFTIAKDAEGTEVKEGEKTAEQKRDEVLAAIHDGMTDEEFNTAVTALGYSASPMSISRNYSVEEIRSFLYDDSRKAGDLLTTYENDTNYYVVRFASREEELYRNQTISNVLLNEKYNEIISKDEVKVDENMMQYANTDLTFYNNSSES